MVYASVFGAWDEGSSSWAIHFIFNMQGEVGLMWIEYYYSLNIKKKQLKSTYQCLPIKRTIHKHSS